MVQIWYLKSLILEVRYLERNNKGNKNNWIKVTQLAEISYNIVETLPEKGSGKILDPPLIFRLKAVPLRKWMKNSIYINIDIFFRLFVVFFTPIVSEVP